MKALIVGAGPAGLAFATLLARSDPRHDIRVIERAAAGTDPGWGVTIRNYALDFLGADAHPLMQKLRGRACWYNGDVAVDLPYPPTDGLHTISRADLQASLAAGCAEAGVRIDYSVDARRLTPQDLQGYDLVVVADGRGSAIRTMHADAFAPSIDYGRNRYTWLGTDTPFDTLTILLEDGELPLVGWSYRYTASRSTFIVEASQQTLDSTGLDRMGADEAAAAIARCFARPLNGGRVLHSGSLRWEAFPMLSCARLRRGNIVLLGDAAHTTHFSQGFGTMFAFDDAIALHEAIVGTDSIDAALERYEEQQRPKIESFQALSVDSMRWSESTVAALTAHDGDAVRAQIDLRWPGNQMPPAPMRPTA